MIGDIERTHEALHFIDASDRDTWLRIGMAIKSEFDDSGFAVWEEWSMKAESFNAKDARDVWKSIQAGGKVTIGTLLYEAKENGWRDDGMHQRPTPEELETRRQAATDRENRDKLAIERERAETAKKAAAILKVATSAKSDHPYLYRKQVSPVATLREIEAGQAAAILGYAPMSGGDQLAGRLLVVPVKQGDGISTLELIDGDKRKAALAGRGSKVGGYWATERLPDNDGNGLILLIGEGMATVLSAKEATGHPAIAALSSGNLPAVAKAIRERYPAAALVILADLVKATGAPDPHAIEAAKIGPGKMAVPDFGSDRDPYMTDFNDLFILGGAEAVAQAIANAMPVPVAIHHACEDGTTYTDSNDWPDPQQIPDSLLPVDVFDDALLPTSLRGWVSDIAERMQCPPDFPAVGAMVALSSVIGRKACIQPKRHDEWQVVPNLWGTVVGRPGVMKSPALSEVMKPLERLAIAANKEHEKAMREFLVSEQINTLTVKASTDKAAKLVKEGKSGEAEMMLMAAMEGSELPLPVLRRYRVTDSTVEALEEILIENPWGTLAYRDELNGLLRGLDKPGQEGSRAFYLQAYDGNQGYTIDRLGRGRNRHIPAVCLSMLGGIQPGKLKAYIHDAVRGGAGDDGLLQRFGLLVWPDITGDWANVDRWPDSPAKKIAYESFLRLDAMQPGTDLETGEPAPVVYRFAADAQIIFEEWRQSFETSLRSGDHHPAMESHLSKYRKLVPALALVCALADDESEVSKDSLLRSLAWSEYLQSHAERAYSAGVRPVTEGAVALLAKIKSGAIADGFKPADVYLKGWTHLSETDDTNSAIKMLCDLGYIKRIEHRPGARGGRPSATFQINPRTAKGK